MTLKEECIDFLKLISESFNKDVEEMDGYEIAVDEEIQMCTLNGVIMDYEYGNCYECPHDNDNECPYRKFIKMDVVLRNFIEDIHYYMIFGKIPEDKRLKKKIKYINTHKQLMNLLREIKNEIESITAAYSEFANKCENLKEYAKEFGNQITNEYYFFQNVNVEIVPMVFHFGYRKDHDWNGDTFTGGDFCTYGKQSIINIYDVIEADMDILEQRVRHEMLHYYLYMVNLKNGDECAIFHYLCNKYNANAYKKMPEDEQLLYDKVYVGTRYYESKLYTEMCKKQNIEPIPENIKSSLLYAIGKVEIDEKMKYLLDSLDLYYKLKDEILRSESEQIA